MSEDKLKDIRVPGKKINIHTQNGTNQLEGCYFYPSPILDGVYLWCNEDNDTLAVVTSGQSFIFEHDHLIWRVPNPELGSMPFVINPDFASGSWWNNAIRSTADEDGTFTATAGGGTDGESASYATAK